MCVISGDYTELWSNSPGGCDTSSEPLVRTCKLNNSAAIKLGDSNARQKLSATSALSSHPEEAPRRCSVVALGITSGTCDVDLRVIFSSERKAADLFRRQFDLVF